MISSWDNICTTLTQHFLQKSFTYKVLLLHKQTFQCFSYFKVCQLVASLEVMYMTACRDCLHLPLFYAFSIHMATLMTLCLLLIYMTERGKGSHHNSHCYLQWNILVLLDMAQIKSESDECCNETNEETNCSKHNAFNNPFLSTDKELCQLSHHYSSKLFHLYSLMAYQ